MFTVTTTFKQNELEQAVRLASSNYVELINKFVRPYGPTSGLCKVQVETEVKAYLEDVLYKNMGTDAGAVFVKDIGTGEVIGFSIYLSGLNPTDCGLNYMVVDKRHRRQGIMKAMVDEIRKTHLFIGLSCNIDKVPYYEAIGFVVTGPELSQVAMSWGVNKPHPSMKKIGFEDSVTINKAVEEFLRSNAQSALILRKIAQAQEVRYAQVKEYVRKRLSGLTHDQSI